MKENKRVIHPSHYNNGAIEVLDLIQPWKLNFCVGNAIKYIARAGLKNKNTEIEDLEKAINYLKIDMQDISRREFIQDDDVIYYFSGRDFADDWKLNLNKHMAIINIMPIVDSNKGYCPRAEFYEAIANLEDEIKDIQYKNNLVEREDK